MDGKFKEYQTPSYMDACIYFYSCIYVYLVRMFDMYTEPKFPQYPSFSFDDFVLHFLVRLAVVVDWCVWPGEQKRYGLIS